MIIRDMQAPDLPAVLEIERHSFTTPWSETSFLGEVHNRRGVALVAEIDGAVAGYLCMRTVLDEGHLLDLAVHAAHRRKGVARALFAEALAKVVSRGCTSVYLEVRASNAVARGFYEGLGFRHVGTRKAYYGSPAEDGAVMVLGLKGFD